MSSNYQRGLEMRKSVMGEEYVERALAGVNQYTAPLQEYVTESCWGAVWARPGLEPRLRSMITVAMLTALNRQRELQAHMAGALRNGVTREELAEILLHANVYCGAPAAMDAFRSMAEVFSAADGTARTES